MGAQFWAAATGTRLSPPRGDDGQFATLLPDRADACWRVQRLDSGRPSVHLDLHGDMPSLERDLVARGAGVVERYDDVVVLRSPGGLPFCVVAGDEAIRPAPVDWGTHTSLLDQVCLDVPAASLEQEIAFWTGALDTVASGSTRRPEFTNLDAARPPAAAAPGPAGRRQRRRHRPPGPGHDRSRGRGRATGRAGGRGGRGRAVLDRPPGSRRPAVLRHRAGSRHRAAQLSLRRRGATSLDHSRDHGSFGPVQTKMAPPCSSLSAPSTVGTVPTRRQPVKSALGSR